MFNAKELSNVLEYHPSEMPITTFYLNLDEESIKQRQHKIVLKDLFRYKTEKSYYKNLSDEAQSSIQDDFNKIEDFITMQLNQIDGKKSLAVFSCSSNDLWETLDLSVPLETSMVINPHPYLRPLVEASSAHRKYAIILVDRAKARILEVDMGQTTEHLHIHEEDMPDQVKEGNFEGTSERRIERHINDHVRQHLKKVAEKALQLQQSERFQWIYLGGRQEILSEFEKALHSYVRENVEGTIIVEPHAPLEEVLKKAEKAEATSREKYETNLLNQLSDEIGKSARGIAGIPGILNAQRRGQIDTLLVQQDFSTKGFYCPECNYMTIRREEEKCPLDDAQLLRTPDIIDNLINDVIKQGASVEMIQKGMDDFDQIGALLRFPIGK